MIISGWANNSIIRSEIFYPKNEHEIIEIVKSLKNESIITRGLGRSYGDISLNKNTLSLEKCEKHFKLDHNLGILSCSANISIVEILEKIVNNGWLLNISPGSKFVTIGGAIANDVHGKNHHRDGSFSDYIEKIKIVTPDGVIRECSGTINQELFRATCGGAGLTGVITSVNLKLLKIKSKNIDVQIFKTKNIKETLKKFEELKKSKYLVAWLDTVNIGSYIKSVIFAAEHSVDNNLDFKIKKGFKIPNFLGKFLINNFFMSIFNKIYYFLHRDSIKIKKDLDSFFYPLDQVCNLNELYGKKGFTQIQVLIKFKDKDKYEKILNQILNF